MDAEQEAMRALHHEHAGVLWSVAMRSTGDPGRAHDAVQEVLLRAWRHPEVFDERRGSLRAWLLRTLRNVLIDDWRSRSARPETLTDVLPERSARYGVTDDVDAAMQSLLVSDALRRLGQVVLQG